MVVELVKFRVVFVEPIAVGIVLVFVRVCATMSAVGQSCGAVEPIVARAFPTEHGSGLSVRLVQDSVDVLRGDERASPTMDEPFFGQDRSIPIGFAQSSICNA